VILPLVSFARKPLGPEQLLEALIKAPKRRRKQDSLSNVAELLPDSAYSWHLLLQMQVTNLELEQQ
jgi:hypothetical protein